MKMSRFMAYRALFRSQSKRWVGGALIELFQGEDGIYFYFLKL